MTGTVSLCPLSELEARELTREIAQTLAVAWEKVVEAYQRRVWEPLGYGSWDSYCRAELGSTRLRLPSEEREEAVRSLRSAGLSTRAIASATGISRGTQHRTASGPNGPLAHANIPVTGLNGKFYAGSRAAATDVEEPIDAQIVDDEKPPPAASTAKRRPLAEAAKDAGWEIRRAAERITRIVGDDRLPTNKQQVSSALRSHLLFVAEAVTAALGELSDHNH
ncbi:MAG: hypothetical protein ACJ72I_05240 [Pseudonocardiaceae bacterium]